MKQRLGVPVSMTLAFVLLAAVLYAVAAPQHQHSDGEVSYKVVCSTPLAGKVKNTPGLSKRS